MPVSVEAIKGYIDLARETLGTDNKAAIGEVMIDLARQVHPLVLGDSYRRRQQTQTLAEKLLAPHVKNVEDRKKIISFLSSDSGSHDYTLNRREAADLGLHVNKCSRELYVIVNEIYTNFREEMKLREPFSVSQYPPAAVTAFSNVRALVESTADRPVHFITEGSVIRQPLPPPAIGENQAVEVTSEGWRTIA